MLVPRAAAIYGGHDHAAAVGAHTPAARQVRAVGQVQSACAQGRLEQAARLFGAAAALRERIDTPLPQALAADYAQAMSATQVALGEVHCAEVWAAGRALPLERSIAEATARADQDSAGSLLSAEGSSFC